MRAVVACAVTLIAALLLAACTTLPPPAAPNTLLNTTTGRFALNATGTRPDGTPLRESMSGRFTLSVATDSTTLDLASPLGNTLARLQSNASGALLQVPEDGGLRTVHNSNPEALAEDVLGFPLPLKGLPWWIQGEPAPDRPAQVQDINHIEQDGWRIQIEERFERSATPRRLTLLRPAADMSPAITLRVVVDEENRDLTPINSGHEVQEKRGQIEFMRVQSPTESGR